ncbi:DNA translocase FtsK [Chitinibacter tainanensis]|uniref:DNA translocase FtsK n=1 Tax=Chitinibacter tainanensis TaxID=230667 RepID=UPI000A056678
MERRCIMNCKELIGGGPMPADFLYQYAVALVLETNRASASGLQRLMCHQLGENFSYKRILRLVERMEQEGLVSPMSSDGARIVLCRQDR